MKLVNRKTRKAIEKSVRKAFKKHGPKLVAALAGSIASSVATLASTTAPDTAGKSNLGALVDRTTDAVTGKSRKGPGKASRRGRHSRHSAELEGTQPDQDGTEAQPHLT